MKPTPTAFPTSKATASASHRRKSMSHRRWCRSLAGCGLWLSLALVSGCSSTGAPAGLSAAEATGSGADAILEGDVLKIDFAGAPSLNTVQEVRRDGRISLPMAGEVAAAGMTPGELAAELRKRYASDLVSNDVTVTVVSSSYEVHVTGAVLKPGKYASKRPLTALEAVMEAGGFDGAKANMKHVVIVRHDNGKVQNYVLDLSLPLEAKPSEPFYLKSADIVFVPARFVWF